MSLPRYGEYKDSGERWLGAVPSHWQIHRLKNLFEIRKRIVGEDGHQVLSITQRGIKVKDIESNDGQLSMDYSKYQVVHPGEFAMNHMDLLTGFVDISPFAGVTSPDYRVFGVRDGVVCEPRYFLYLLQNGYRQKVFYAFGKGASEFGRWRFPTDQFNDFRFPCPPPAEQTTIAAFLDRETAKIDALIAEQEKLIALLAEKRQATISNAVTKGLDPNAPMKDSGVMWLGEVPAHWEFAKLKRLCDRITDGAHISPETEAGIYSFVSTKDLCGDSIDFDGCLLTSAESFEYLQRTGCRPFVGDVLFSKDGTIGRTVVVSDEREFVVASSLIIITPTDALLDAEFLNYLCKSTVISRQVDGFVKGAGLPRLSIQNLLKVFGVFPPVDEQRAISEYLKAEDRKLDTLRAESERAIGLLKERRSALIAAAVTGQIEVRGAVSAAHVAREGLTA